jgi:lauroyl/myristoyl acyltransferase
MHFNARSKLPWRIRYLCDGVGSLFKVMSIETATRFAQMLARGVFELNPPVRRAIETNLDAALAPDLTPEQRMQLAQQVFENIGSFWVELLHCRRRLSPRQWPEHVQVEDLSYWRTLARGKRPILLTTGYFGNPAVAACVLSELLGTVHAVVDPVARTLIEAGGGWDQRFHHLKLVDAGRLSWRAPGILKVGGRLLILAGQQTTGAEGVDARFLGHDGRHHATIARLAHRHHADIIVFSCRRLPDCPFRFRLALADHIILDERAGSAAAATQQYLDAIERSVLAHPEQYLWTRT